MSTVTLLLLFSRSKVSVGNSVEQYRSRIGFRNHFMKANNVLSLFKDDTCNVLFAGALHTKIETSCYIIQNVEALVDTNDVLQCEYSNTYKVNLNHTSCKSHPSASPPSYLTLSWEWVRHITNNIQATISAFWLVKSMSINPRSVQKSEIECKKVKLSAKKWNWVQNGEIKMIDNSYFELEQTKWRTKIKQRLKLFI